ncbi:putative Binding partner of ACD11 1 [Cocos nucifera]|nr:putative Binding partner of ACD11 1 [Cocos nucifera]
MTVAQDVVKTMLAKGYTLSKDALIKAKALDESYQVSATAAAKIAELSKRIGLTDRINAGVDRVRSVDERYHVSETTKTVVSATGRTAVSVANSIVSSSYFSAGALLVSDALKKAAEAAKDLAAYGKKQ